MKLGEFADIIRSKNAGIYYITIDVMFEEQSKYDKLKQAEIIDIGTITEIYDVEKEKVEIYQYDPGQSFKITIERSSTAGSIRDGDVYGAQQHVPVYDIELPSEIVE